MLLVGLLVLSTHLLWAQGSPLLDKIPIQLLDSPAPFARVSETQTPLHSMYGRLPLTFEQNPGQPESRMRFFRHYPDYYRLPLNTDAALPPATRTGGLWSKEKYLMGSAPSKWLTFAPHYSNVPHETTLGVENLDHFGHHIPWIGSIILRMAQQAKSHPHVTRLLMVLKPRL
jgi:hypothetical protein